MCKYCSKLGTGDCNDFVFDINYPLSIGGVEIGRLCIDTLIIENDHNNVDNYDIKRDGIVWQTTVGTEDGRHIIRSTKRIKFCPFCGANLEDVFHIAHKDKTSGRFPWGLGNVAHIDHEDI